MEFMNDVMFWREALTVFCFGLFLSICLWAYSKNRKKEFDDISALLLMDNDTDWNLTKNAEATSADRKKGEQE